MKTVFLIAIVAALALPCVAGTNVTVRVVEDDHADARWQVYSHGTNLVLKIHHRHKLTSITSSASGYSVTHTDDDGDGITDSIMISEANGKVLEVLNRSADGSFAPSSQQDIDEMNKLAQKIEAGIPKRKK